MAIESKMSRELLGGKKRFPPWVVWVGILFVIALLGGTRYYFSELRPQTDDGATQYQAVFLDNGQVYFGKLERTNDTFYILTDVYYLQSGVAIDQTSDLSLTKLGNEAHGPTDRMEIHVDHILFIENMKSDASIVQAIQQYKSKN